MVQECSSWFEKGSIRRFKMVEEDSRWFKNVEDFIRSFKKGLRRFNVTDLDCKYKYN